MNTNVFLRIAMGRRDRRGRLGWPVVAALAALAVPALARIAPAAPEAARGGATLVAAAKGTVDPRPPAADPGDKCAYRNPLGQCTPTPPKPNIVVPKPAGGQNAVPLNGAVGTGRPLTTTPGPQPLGQPQIKPQPVQPLNTHPATLPAKTLPVNQRPGG
jgi:hypothetical protein